jgi:hypothetical protein
MELKIESTASVPNSPAIQTIKSQSVVLEPMTDIVLILKILHEESVTSSLTEEELEKLPDPIVEHLDNLKVFAPYLEYVVKKNKLKGAIYDARSRFRKDQQIHASITKSNLSPYPIPAAINLIFIGDKIMYRDLVFEMDEYEEISLDELIEIVSGNRDPYARWR